MTARVTLISFGRPSGCYRGVEFQKNSDRLSTIAAPSRVKRPAASRIGPLATRWAAKTGSNYCEI